jgi:D-alanyl-D-alanine carboxypeptidase/D-alanyl-D-alanine-endopeptidase (penicillin-binding protein 4)
MRLVRSQLNTLLLLVVAMILLVPSGLSASTDSAATKAVKNAKAGDGTSAARHKKKRKAAAAPAPIAYLMPTSAVALNSDITSLLGHAQRGGRWGVMVISLSRGDTLFSLNADSSLQPASNMKLFTSALALDQFGPSHQFRTEVLRTGDVDADGTLHGDLVLRGDGDPALSPRFVDGGPNAPMERLAQTVADAGIKKVAGHLVADASAFDPQRIPEGWKRRYLSAAYAAPVSALSLNENVLQVVVRPGKANGKAEVVLEPASDYPLSVSVKTVEGRGSRVAAWTDKGGAIEVHGWIGTRAGERRYELVAGDPTAYTAGAFRRALADRGIKLEGATQFAITPAHGVKIGDLPSPPLGAMLSVMNRESINHFAELIFRDAARNAAPDSIGSAESGNALLQRFLVGKVGVDSNAVVAADGSGLSTIDRVTPRSLVQLLAFSHRTQWSDAFHASLPVAGETELLARRMRATPAQGNLHAKTGTTNTVISLGGYVTAQDGELLAFAFIYNGWDRYTAKSTIDAMGATLASFVRE